MPPLVNDAPAAVDLDQTLATLLAQLGELTNNMARLHGPPHEVSPQQLAPDNAALPPAPPPATDNNQQPPLATPTPSQQPSLSYDQPAHAPQHQHSQQDLHPIHDSATAPPQAPLGLTTDVFYQLQTFPTPPPQPSPFMAMSLRLQSQSTPSPSDPAATTQPPSATHLFAPSADTSVSDASPLQPTRTRSSSRQNARASRPSSPQTSPARGEAHINRHLPALCHYGREAGPHRPTTTTLRP